VWGAGSTPSWGGRNKFPLLTVIFTLLYLSRVDSDPGWLKNKNPFISITASKPLISSGSWLTLNNCDIYYLSAGNYDPATTDLIFIRVNIYPGPGEGVLQLISEPLYCIRVTIYHAALPYNISRGHYLPRGVGGGGLLLIFQPIYFYQGHYLSPHLIPQY
jgi:hypothetical protein